MYHFASPKAGIRRFEPPEVRLLSCIEKDMVRGEGGGWARGREVQEGPRFNGGGTR